MRVFDTSTPILQGNPKCLRSEIYDASIKLATTTVDANYSQKYEYDFASRLKKNDMSGLVTGGPAVKYKQTLGYDAFSNITSRATTIDGET